MRRDSQCQSQGIETPRSESAVSGRATGQNNPTIPEEFLSLQEMYSSKIKEINQILGQIRQTMRNEALKSSNIFGKAFLFHNDMTEQEVAALKMFKESFNELSKFLSTSQFVIDKPSSRPRL